MIICDDIDPHPYVYRNFLMILSVITPFFNMYAIFCIVKTSTKQMASYKWWLLIYQLTSSIFAFVFTTLIIPVMAFPVIMGYADSYIARWTSLSLAASIRIFGSCIVLTLATSLNLFIYRCYVVIPHNHWLKLCLRGPWIHITVLFICCVCTFVGLIDFVPDQMQTRRRVLEEYSCAKTVIDEPRLTIITADSAHYIIVIGVTLNFSAAISAFCLVSLSYYFLSTTNQMSQRTRLMQRRYLISLIIQVSTPAITLFTPACSVLIGWFFLTIQIGQVAGNFAVGVAALYCLIAPLSLIFCNDTYRNYTLNKIKYGWKSTSLQEERKRTTNWHHSFASLRSKAVLTKL